MDQTVGPSNLGERATPTARASGSAVDKALDLVEVTARAGTGLRLSEMADQVGMHRATAYRVLGELVRRGWIIRHEGRYCPGAVLLQLAQYVTARSTTITTVCRPILEALAARTNMMSNLQVLEPDGSRVIDAVRPKHYEMITHLIGELLPAHRFAGPLALVAALPRDRRSHYLELAAADGDPVDGPDRLRREIAEVQRTGFAVVRCRADSIVASVSRAVPSASGEAMCALTVIGLDAELDAEHLALIKDELVTAVAAVEERLTSHTDSETAS